MLMVESGRIMMETDYLQALVSTKSTFGSIPGPDLAPFHSSVASTGYPSVILTMMLVHVLSIADTILTATRCTFTMFTMIEMSRVLTTILKHLRQFV